MSVPDIPDQLELAVGVPLVDEDASVQAADNEQRVLLEEDDPHDALILELVVLPRLHFLQEVPRLAAVLPHKARRVAHEKLPTLIAKLSGSDMRLMLVIVEFGEDLLEGASDEVVDADVVGGEQKDGVGARADPEVEDGVELVDLLRLLFEGRGSELGDLLLADQALGEFGDYLQPGGVYEVFLAVYDLDCLEFAEVPDAHAELVVEGENVRE